MRSSKEICDRFYETDHRWHVVSRPYVKGEQVYRYMRCANYKNVDVKCKATGVKFDSSNEVQIKTHHKVYCRFNVDAAKQRTALAKDSACVSDSAYRTFQNVRASHPEWEQALPFSKLKDTIRRCIKQNCPCMPTHLVDLANVLQHYTWRKRLQYSTHKTADKNASSSICQIEITNVIDEEDFCHVVFYSPDFVKRVLQFDVTDGAADSTYKTLPLLKGCYQFLIFMVVTFGKCTPLFYVIMSRKTEKAYTAVFRAIRNLEPNLKLEKITTDFEDALKNGLKANYPEIVEFTGCFFHHVYNIGKWCAKHRLIMYIQKYSAVEKFVKKTKNLALLPVTDIESTFDSLVAGLSSEKPVTIINDESKEITLLALLEDFIRYYRNTWIKKVTPNEYSVYLEDQRTNNDLERINRTWHELTGNHPRLIVFLDALVKMIHKVHVDYNENRFCGSTSSKPPAEEESRKNFLKVGWERIQSLGESSSFRHRQQVIMEFLENSVHLMEDFHFRVDFLTSGEEPPHGEPETCAAIRNKEWCERLVSMRDTVLTCPICDREYCLERYFINHLLHKHKLKQCSQCRKYLKSDCSTSHTCIHQVAAGDKVATTSTSPLNEEEGFHDGVTDTSASTATACLIESKKLQCSICSREYNDSLQLEIHMLELHDQFIKDEDASSVLEEIGIIQVDNSCPPPPPVENVPTTAFSLNERMQNLHQKIHLKRKSKLISQLGSSRAAKSSRTPLSTLNFENGPRAAIEGSKKAGKETGNASSIKNLYVHELDTEQTISIPAENLCEH